MEFNEAVTAPYPAELTASWQQVYTTVIDRAIDIYRENPPYCQLILGPNTPPAIKLSGPENDANPSLSLNSPISTQSAKFS